MLLLLVAILTGLAVLVLLLTSFMSHCYFLRHRDFGFEMRELPCVALLLYFLTEDGLRIIRNVSKQNMYSFLMFFSVLINSLFPPLYLDSSI